LTSQEQYASDAEGAPVRPDSSTIPSQEEDTPVLDETDGSTETSPDSPASPEEDTPPADEEPPAEEGSDLELDSSED